MIKFFRKIRQNLLMEKKTGKYFKYAFGEIILVVIGILIALQINNWNQKRLEKQQSQEYHERIIEDLDLMIKSMKGEIGRATKVKKYIVSSLRILNSKELNIADKDTLDYAFKNYFQFVLIDNTLNSIEEMKSTGKIGLIYNKEIRNRLDEYLEYLRSISKIYVQISSVVNENNAIQSEIYIKVAENYKDNEVIYNFNELRNNQKLKNKLSRVAVAWQTKKSFSQRILRNSENLKAAIKKELQHD